MVSIAFQKVERVRKMNTQNDFLDNAVDDGVVTDGAGDLDAEMCSYIQNDTEEMCSSLRNDTC